MPVSGDLRHRLLCRRPPLRASAVAAASSGPRRFASVSTASAKHCCASAPPTGDDLEAAERVGATSPGSLVSGASGDSKPMSRSSRCWPGRVPAHTRPSPLHPAVSHGGLTLASTPKPTSPSRWPRESHHGRLTCRNQSQSDERLPPCRSQSCRNDLESDTRALLLWTRATALLLRPDSGRSKFRAIDAGAHDIMNILERNCTEQTYARSGTRSIIPVRYRRYRARTRPDTSAPTSAPPQMRSRCTDSRRVFL